MTAGVVPLRGPRAGGYTWFVQIMPHETEADEDVMENSDGKL
jgi:hypothetical protein